MYWAVETWLSERCSFGIRSLWMKQHQPQFRLIQCQDSESFVSFQLYNDGSPLPSSPLPAEHRKLWFCPDPCNSYSDIPLPLHIQSKPNSFFIDCFLVIFCLFYKADCGRGVCECTYTSLFFLLRWVLRIRFRYSCLQGTHSVLVFLLLW